MRTAVLGYGTVGKGVWEMLSATGRAGKVLVRQGKSDEPFKTEDYQDIISDESIDIVAECMGGVNPAYEYAVGAINAGKAFITSNKALVAAKGPELSALAREKGVSFLFSAACGGAIPFLYNIRTAVDSGEKIEYLEGILNGTTNYILDAMQSFGTDYPEALAKAQELGYAEKDPTADVSGMDAMRKIMLGCAAAYELLPSSGFCVEGIENFTAEDVKHIKSFGLVCRLKGYGSKSGNTVAAFVQPVLVPEGCVESTVRQNGNMARYKGKYSDEITITGRGAGRYPTASAVMRDIACAENQIKDMMLPSCRYTEANNSGVLRNYYVRTDEKYGYMLDREFTKENGYVRGITGMVSVKEMHDKAEEIRRKGGRIFFAALEKDIDA